MKTEIYIMITVIMVMLSIFLLLWLCFMVIHDLNKCRDNIRLKPCVLFRAGEDIPASWLNVIPDDHFDIRRFNVDCVLCDDVLYRMWKHDMSVDTSMIIITSSTEEKGIDTQIKFFGPIQDYTKSFEEIMGEE